MFCINASPVRFSWSHLCEPLVIKIPWLGVGQTMTIYPAFGAIASDRGVAMHIYYICGKMVMARLEVVDFWCSGGKLKETEVI